MWLVGSYGGRYREKWGDEFHRFSNHHNTNVNSNLSNSLHKEIKMIRNLRDQEKVDYILIGICIGIGLGFILSMWYLHPPF